MAEAVILVGLQGAGKTTYFHAHLAATHDHVSGDVQGTRQKNVMEDAIRAGRSFAVDNTNVTRRARKPWIDAARAAGYRVICIYFETPTREALGRNRHRTDKKPIPVPAILKAAKDLEPPSLDEGFDEIRMA